MRRSRAYAFLPAVLLAAALPAGRAAAEMGEAAGMTLLQPVSARPVGLAEAYSAVSGRADCLGYNPAGLAGIDSRRLSGLYHGGFAGDTFVGLLFGAPLKEAGMAVSLGYYNSGSVERLEESGEVNSVSGQRDFLLSAGAGALVPGTNVSAGAAVRILSTQLIEELSGSAAAFDLGVGYGLPKLGMRLGAAVSNFGGKLKIGDASDDLPSLVRAGLTYSVLLGDSPSLAVLGGLPSPNSSEPPAADRVTLFAEMVSRLTEGALQAAAGMEYLAAESLALRVGWRNLISGTTDNSGVICVGIGADVGGAVVDYAAEVTRFVVMHRMGVSLKI